MPTQAIQGEVGAEIAASELDKLAVKSATTGKKDTLAALFIENFYAMDEGPATVKETGLEHLTVEINSVLTTCRVQEKEERSAPTHHRGGECHLGDKKWRLFELSEGCPRLRKGSM